MGELGQLLSVNEVTARLGISRTSLNVLRRRGEFIPAIKLGPGRVVFSENAIADWLKSRMA